jgi:hypothetical protein
MVTKVQFFTSDKESWCKNYDPVGIARTRTLTVATLSTAKALTMGPIQTLSFPADTKVTVYHGVTLNRYRRMLRLCSWDRTLSRPPGDFSISSALYFANDWTYAFLWANLKTTGYKTMKLERGIVLSVTMDLGKLGPLSYVTEEATESTIASHMAAIPVDNLRDVVMGGFRKAHLSELRGEVSIDNGRMYLTGCSALSTNGLLQV